MVMGHNDFFSLDAFDMNPGSVFCLESSFSSRLVIVFLLKKNVAIKQAKSSEEFRVWRTVA